MTDFVLGADNINGGESAILQKMKTVLESKGHSVTLVGVGPSVVQNYGKTSGATGRIGIQVVGGRCIGTACDFLEGMNRGYYKYKMMGFAFCSWTASRYITCKDLKEYKFQKRAHDDNFSSNSLLSKYKANTGQYSWSEWAKLFKDKMIWACGQSPEELAKNLLSGNGVNDSTSETQSSTIKEALKKLLSYYDGDIECRVLGDRVYVNKIKNPKTAKITISEGKNIVDNSITIKDDTPDAPNKIRVRYAGGYVNLIEGFQLNRFGEKKVECDAVEMKNGKEVLVETKEEALDFARMQLAKLRRENSLEVELKVIPDYVYQVGEWVRLYVPTYIMDKYMYITKISTSHSIEGEPVVSLTLREYPPSFGAYEEEEDTSEEEMGEDVDV